MAETYRTIEEYIFKAEFDEDRGLMFFPTGESVVRCKDCKHWDGETHGCEKHPSAEPWWETDSCNYGERNDEVEE